MRVREAGLGPVVLDDVVLHKGTRDDSLSRDVDSYRRDLLRVAREAARRREDSRAVTDRASIVHVVPRLAMTGPVRGIAAEAKYASRLGIERSQRVVALERELAPPAVLLLRREGLQLTVRPTPAELDDVVRDADLVLVHFWNCPAMFEFLLHPLPPTRMIAWIETQGLDAPQVVPDALVDHVDDVLLTTPVGRHASSPRHGNRHRDQLSAYRWRQDGDHSRLRDHG